MYPLRGVPSHSRSKCPARDSKCWGCGRKGHWVWFCLSKVQEVNDRDGESDDESDAYLGTIDSESAVLSSISSNSDEPWIIDLKVGQGFIRFKIDCGADVTVISEDLKIGKLPLEKSSKRLYGPGNVTYHWRSWVRLLQSSRLMEAQRSSVSTLLRG